MKKQDEIRIKQLLQQALPPVDPAASPSRDLWPAVLRRLDEPEAPLRASAGSVPRGVPLPRTVPPLTVPWFDWALLAPRRFRRLVPGHDPGPSLLLMKTSSQFAVHSSQFAPPQTMLHHRTVILSDERSEESKDLWLPLSFLASRPKEGATQRSRFTIHDHEPRTTIHDPRKGTNQCPPILTFALTSPAFS